MKKKTYIWSQFSGSDSEHIKSIRVELPITQMTLYMETEKTMQE